MRRSNVCSICLTSPATTVLLYTCVSGDGKNIACCETCKAIRSDARYDGIRIYEAIARMNGGKT